MENTRHRAILAPENMRLAWEQVLAKKGAPGVDQITLQRWARNWEVNIERLRTQASSNTYQPNWPRRILVRKKDGGFREISMLTVSDKVLQRAVLNIIEPDFDSRFLSSSHGYRPRRSVATAIDQVLTYRDQGLRWVLDADIQACFDSIDHGLLMTLIRRVIEDWFTLNLTEKWLFASRKQHSRPVGIPLGAVLSPLWCNIILHQLDARLSSQKFKLVRYADDFLVFGETQEVAQAAMQATMDILAQLKLSLSAQKTRVTSFKAGFRFLGVAFYKNQFSYQWEHKKIQVEGRNTRLLYQHVPQAYQQRW
jgi:RNA-directed DNA polymerase